MYSSPLYFICWKKKQAKKDGTSQCASLHLPLLLILLVISSGKCFLNLYHFCFLFC
ncbi:hypothetical protein NC653_007440 [Populus alba x Populus x berolinensis]|uniref:Uncharacterized protein n=1 Tax=Populus alba x Populus x berolinensis TaxID=444605 RepID=A0AAD6RGV7_9ROSI|nr:hypothetical protein NC653_007440 [Populus alba x Populus x berolinensis]